MNPFVKFLMSPLGEWHVATLGHKIFVGAAGAGMFGYLHKYQSKWPMWKKALASAGTAYGVSVLLHAVSRFGTPTPPAGLPPAAPAPPQVPQPIVPIGGPPGMTAPMAPPMSSAPLDLNSEAPPKMELEDESLSGEGIFG